MIESKEKKHQVPGVLLVNVGTPEKPEPDAVRRYLREFLMDPWVLDIPFLYRWVLVHGLILPKRSVTSANAYRKIWGKEGSPLRVHLVNLAAGVQRRLGGSWEVGYAMRYGHPSLRDSLQQFRSCSELLVVPLYPQFSLAATESCIREVRRVAKKFFPELKIKIMRPFYNEPSFTRVFAQRIRETEGVLSSDHLLFSFHGLPERQIRKTDSKSHCFSQSDCCEAFLTQNPNCYRAQCFATAKAIAKELALDSAQYTVCFQSRLGRTPWIKPYTDEVYRELPARGIKRLGVVCPAFVADCLETLEEIQIRGKEEFIRAGGEDLTLVPSLNSDSRWVQALSDMIAGTADQD